MSLLRYLRSRRQPCFKKAHYRRNGWDVKPRHGKDPNALIVEDKWWHDSSKSVYWQYFKDDTSFNERTIQAVEFYDEATWSSTCEFHKPRAASAGRQSSDAHPQPCWPCTPEVQREE